ncbi:MAG: hypothetical protein PHF70_10585 [Opitutales bacterium]|nr:hypothetical protein [Opitutales bacterium]
MLSQRSPGDWKVKGGGRIESMGVGWRMILRTVSGAINVRRMPHLA